MINVLIIIFVLILSFMTVSYIISNMIIKNKQKSEKQIQELMKESLSEDQWNDVWDWFSNVKKTRFNLKSIHGYKITGFYIQSNPDSDRWIIISHGVTVSKTRSAMYAKMFSELKFNCVVYDQRFHGESTGKYITYGYYERDDMKALVDNVKKRYSPNILGIHGESMGASITLMYAGSVEDGTDFYIVDCPYDNFYDQVEYQLAQMIPLPTFLKNGLLKCADLFIQKRAKFSLKQVNPLKYMNKIKSPVMIIHCKGDEYIPIDMSYKLYEAKRTGIKENYWVDEGAHAVAYQEDPDRYKKEISDFLSKIIPPE